ncbi:hypothetical protein ALC62_14796 [Cyphomyrmex costatus]|uniref:C2H2-type domain-containing protein n=1 Tax=Cyphomyrmex costatus TaxID=456900 RepID=A0A151I8C6_9HYME|nr:hypothetical protein ALC62_14796 [Cyphomyrmex costatus]
MANGLICFICKKTLYGVRNFSSHFRRSHALMLTKYKASGFFCKQDNCDKHFFKYNSFIRHIKKCHIENVVHSPSSVSIETMNRIENEFPMEVEVPEIGIHANEQMDLSEIENNAVVEHNNAVIENVKSIHDIHSSAAKMISALRVSSSFTGTALKEVVAAVEILLSDILDFVQDKVTDFCTSKDIDVKDPTVETLLSKFKCNDLFKNMDTLTGQIEVLKKNYKYIQPREIPLGYRVDQRFNICKQEWEQKQVYETIQYVSIIETLQLIMSHTDVREYVNLETRSDHDWLVNFIDGQSFQAHEFFNKYPNALRIQLYYDDIVVNNPLGSRVQPHKIGAFYFLIQNLPQYLNSFLGAIHVLILSHTADIDKYDMAAILRPFLQDMKALESDNGVITISNGVEWTLRATLAVVCADGLAAHQLFGLVSPAALHFCRLCMINRNDFKNNINSVTYIAGFVARNVTKIIKCEICASYLIQDKVLSHLQKRKCRGGLISASENLVETCLIAEKVFRTHNNNVFTTKNIISKLVLETIATIPSDVFKNETHLYDQSPLGDHRKQLLEIILITKYFNLRLHHKSASKKDTILLE